MKLGDALFNWLQIRVVADARPNDRSAQETVNFFRQILTEDHQVGELEYQKDDAVYTVRYQHEGKTLTQQFPIEAVEQLLEWVEQESEQNR
ncbi:hypothetical protein [Brevibacillus marinus]|uniref:hypothetical protein n=1 Tax=Brevibacillus marinus TaxID=2496837 RepID=UPI000F82B8D9|nr:hypothetical protein [Brevibacillus marinus]